MSKEIRSLRKNFLTMSKEEIFTSIRNIRNTVDFDLATDPESNIICFRYLPPNQKIKDIDLLQTRIRKEILKRGTPYIVQTKLGEGQYLRCTLINPLTKFSDLQEILDIIRIIGNQLINIKQQVIE